MLAWRAKRQLSIIGGIMLMIAFVSLWFFLKPYLTPICFDQKRNQGERDVDCGGPCVPCEVKRAKPVAIFWARGVEVRPHVYDVAALVENQNETVSSAKVEYEFTLFDEDGNEVSRRNGTTYLFSQERTYIIETGIEATQELKRVEVRVVRAEWMVSSKIRPDLIVERREYKVKRENGFGQSIVEAEIANRTAFDFREVEVQFAVFDDSENLIGVNRVVVENLYSSSSELVKSLWPYEFQAKVGKIEVEARANVFDPFTILKPQ